MYRPADAYDTRDHHEHRLAEAEGEQAVYLVCTLCPYFEVKHERPAPLREAQDHQRELHP